MSDFFLIARIVSVYGKDGFVKITSFSDFPDRFFKLKRAYLDFFGDKKEFVVEDVLRQNKIFALKFKNFNNAEDCSVLIGKDVFVDDEGLVKLPAGSYFIHDLVDSKVYRNNKEFGIIKDVLSYPANDVYVIEDTEGKEILIPAVKDFIEGFDPQNKRLTLRPGDDIYENDED